MEDCDSPHICYYLYCNLRGLTQYLQGCSGPHTRHCVSHPWGALHTDSDLPVQRSDCRTLDLPRKWWGGTFNLIVDRLCPENGLMMGQVSAVLRKVPSPCYMFLRRVQHEQGEQISALSCQDPACLVHFLGYVANKCAALGKCCGTQLLPSHWRGQK